MNVILEKLLQNEHLTTKDRYEIRQMFEFLPDGKKQNILDNFDTMLLSIIKIKQDLRREQEILLGRALSNIEKTLKYAKTNGIKNATTRSIGNLKQTI